MINYAYWLSNIPEVGIRTRNRLIAAAGSAREIYGLTEKQLLLIPGVTEKHAARILESRKKDYDAMFEGMIEQGIWFLSREEQLFPERLATIPDAPYSIYVKGNMPAEWNKKTVAIVGARRCSAYGRSVAEKIAGKIAESGAWVVSGMASGVDSGGHAGALEKNGYTCAVLGCGVDICYPRSNIRIYQEILEKNGAVISEYPPGTNPSAPLFPARNRIIAGLADVVVVVEAKIKSGSLITADYALEQGRDIYAVPGRIYDALSGGCNNLIQQGAGIISDVDEFLKEIELQGEINTGEDNLKNLLLEKDERLVYSCLSLRPKNVGELLEKTGILVPDMMDVLARLLQKGFITETVKNYYIRKI